MLKTVKVCDVCHKEIDREHTIDLMYRHSYYDPGPGASHTGHVTRDVCLGCAREAIRKQYPQLDPNNKEEK